MKKVDRQKVYDKFGGKCAYCGKILGNRWHVDHVEAIYRKWSDRLMDEYNLKRGSEDFENKFPSCIRCNCHKSTLSVEQFRHEISMQVERTRKTISGFRMAEDFNLIQETNKPVIFYFETFTLNNPNHE